MDEDERLREALLELNLLKKRDSQLLAQSQAVLDGLERVTRASSPAEALRALLVSVRTNTHADAALLLEAVDTTCTVTASTDPDIVPGTLAPGAFFMNTPRLVLDLEDIEHLRGVFSTAHPYRSLVSAPTITGARTLALVCLSRTRAHFSRSQQQIAAKLIALADQALATKKLADDNALLAEVINRSSASFAIADANDPDLALVYVNDAFEDLTGYSRAEALGQNCRFLSAEEPDSDVRVALRQTVKARGHGEFEVLNKRKSGEHFWNKLTLFPVTTDQSDYLVATQWDLTSRIEAERERDAARQQLEAALTSVREGILLTDPQGAVVIANAKFKDLFGFRATDLGRGERLQTAWKDALLGKGALDADAARQAKDAINWLKQRHVQKERRLESGQQVLETVVETAAGGTVCVLTDVTALKVTERQLAERVSAIDAVQDGIAITDPGGRFVYLNPGQVEMYGYCTATDLIGRKWTQLYAPDQRRFIEDVAIPAVLEHHQWRGDVEGMRKNQSAFPQEVTLTLLESGGLVCVTRDISARVHDERERAALRDQLHSAQRQEAIGQLAAGLAHDFNNCLAVISGSASMALEAQTPAASREHAERIIMASDRAKEITDRLLRFGARKSVRRKLDLRDPLTSAHDLVASSMGRKIDLQLDLPRSAVQCILDPTDLLQIVMNLMINARDAIGAKDGTVRVSLAQSPGARIPGDLVAGTVSSARDYAVLCVDDTGPGIADTEAPSLFDAYKTSKSETGGTGLGLAVVRSLVLANDGAIRIARSPENGARFIVYLPLQPQAPTPVSPTIERPSEFDFSGLRVLIVDDDALVAETIASVLEGEGCDVAICEGGEEAIEAVSAEPEYWSLILTDYDMPGMNGQQLAENIRGLSKELPILLCTAVPEILRGSSLAASLFAEQLTKPVDRKRLLQAVVGHARRSDQ